MRRFVIDTDTASDDAVALVMALMHPEVQVEAITVVAGNVPADQGVKNALYTVELTGKDVPVYRGMAAPLTRPLETAQNVHGQDGLGDIGLPLEGREPAPDHGVDVLIDVINRYAGEITLVSLGPLTNLAMAILRDPSIPGKVKEYVMMGGAGDGVGNVTPVAEYNIWVDPEAAKIVWESGIPITMVGWDISRKYAVFNAEDRQRLRSAGTPLAEFCVDIQGTLDEYALTITKLEGFDLPDPIAMAVALDRSVIARAEHLYVTVDTESDLCRGQTVIDHLGVMNRPPNTEVVLEASRERFLALLQQSVSAT